MPVSPLFRLFLTCALLTAALLPGRPSEGLRAQQPPVIEVPDEDEEDYYYDDSDYEEPVPTEPFPRADDPTSVQRFDSTELARLTDGLVYYRNKKDVNKLRRDKKADEEEEEEEEEPDEADTPTFIRPWMKVVLILLALGLLGVLIYYVLDTLELIEHKQPRTATTVRLEEIEEETITTAEADSLLTRAEKAEQFTLAVRLHYLGLLKTLDRGGLIRYQRDKVNRDYLREMGETEFAAAFGRVTLDYERHWYGEYPLDRLSYRGVNERFLELRRAVEQHYHLNEAAHA